MWSLWLIAAGVFFIVEIATTGFLIFWLGIGALIAMLTSFITESIIIQTITFVISSCILIPLTKPLADKFNELIRVANSGSSPFSMYAFCKQ